MLLMVPKMIVNGCEGWRRSIQKKNVRDLKVLTIFTSGATLTRFSLKMKSARTLIGVYHHTRFEHNSLKTANKQNQILLSSPLRGATVHSPRGDRKSFDLLCWEVKGEFHQLYFFHSWNLRYFDSNSPTNFIYLRCSISSYKEKTTQITLNEYSDRINTNLRLKIQSTAVCSILNLFLFASFLLSVLCGFRSSLEQLCSLQFNLSLVLFSFIQKSLKGRFKLFREGITTQTVSVHHMAFSFYHINMNHAWLHDSE